MSECDFEFVDATPPPYSALLTGHYHRSKGYRIYRQYGTTDWLLIITLDGHGHYRYPSGEIVTDAGDAVLLRPHTPHDYGTAPGAKNWELLWVHFYPRLPWEELLRWPEVTPGLMQISLNNPAIRQKVATRLRETHRFATSAMAHHELFAMNMLEQVLLWCYTQNPTSGVQRSDPRIHTVQEYIQEHLTEKIATEILASICNISVSRFFQLFRQQTGQTPVQYIEAQRLLRAQQLLTRTINTVSVISAEVGFENPFYFTLRFKKYTGLSPTEFRKRFSEQNALTGDRAGNFRAK